MYFEIKETLTESTFEKCVASGDKFVAILSLEEFNNDRDLLSFAQDVEVGSEYHEVTKAEVHHEYMVGWFSIPNRKDLFGPQKHFEYVMNDKCLVLIDNTGEVKDYIDIIRRSKRWRFPCIERFIYDILEYITRDDLALFESYEREMDVMEDTIIDGEIKDEMMHRINEIRGELQELRVHYEQLMDMSQELSDNENGYFSVENLRYFRVVTDKMARLLDILNSRREHTVQLRDLYHYEMDLKQNKMMSTLTVVATIFMPLSLIAGWYGMNFINMPELAFKYGYPIVIGICIIIAVGEIVFFKKKKLL